MQGLLVNMPLIKHKPGWFGGVITATITRFAPIQALHRVLVKETLLNNLGIY